MIFREKIIGFTLFLLINGQFWSKNRNFPEIADDHNSGTKYARDMKFVSKCVVLDTLLYSTNNSISTKSGFRSFWKWALHIIILFFSIEIFWFSKKGFPISLPTPFKQINVYCHSAVALESNRQFFTYCIVSGSSFAWNAVTARRHLKIEFRLQSVVRTAKDIPYF